MTAREVGQRDFSARGCQMCDLAHHSVMRATADSQLEADGNPRLRHAIRGKEITRSTLEGSGGDMREGRWAK